MAKQPCAHPRHAFHVTQVPDPLYKGASKGHSQPTMQSSKNIGEPYICIYKEYQPKGFLLDVPQYTYTSHGHCMPMYQDDPIDFHVNGHRGVRLSEALHGHIPGWNDSQRPMQQKCGWRFLYRIQVGDISRECRKLI